MKNIISVIIIVLVLVSAPILFQAFGVIPLIILTPILILFWVFKNEINEYLYLSAKDLNEGKVKLFTVTDKTTTYNEKLNKIFYKIHLEDNSKDITNDENFKKLYPIDDTEICKLINYSLNNDVNTKEVSIEVKMKKWSMYKKGDNFIIKT